MSRPYFSITNIKEAARRLLSSQPSLVISTSEEEVKQEGQLAVDVYQHRHQIVIIAPVAGVDPSQIQILITQDLLTISGCRELPDVVSPEDFFNQECYWGDFTRSIRLPVAVQPHRIRAKFQNGVLRITIPKSATDQTQQIKIKVEE